MSPLLVFGVIAAYFALLLLVSYFTSREANNQAFFTGNRRSPWYLVAFGMIGASLSGVTFISVPGWVANSGFSYLQMVLGYLVGYFVIATVLMPMYYKLNLTSIYTYLHTRFGLYAYKTGSAFFLLSRTIGASFRLYLVAMVLQLAFFDAFQIPFFVTVLVTIALIWIYTFRAGIKTIVWTDTLQTFFMLASLVITLIIVANSLNVSLLDLPALVRKHPYSETFFWDWKSGQNFYKQFIAGAFIAIVMTGLDQDMMQKNLTCRNIGEAKKNMFWFSIALVPVNLLFLSLGVLLYVYAAAHDIVLPQKADELYPFLAMNHFPLGAAVVFLLGIIAAAFSSADSALTALTTAFCVDFLNFDNKKDAQKQQTRLWVHIGFSFLLFLVISAFSLLKDQSVVASVFKVAGYTYGPLLGMFALGMFSKISVKDKLVPIVAIASPIITYIINIYSEQLFGGYQFGFELLILNGAITFVGMWLTGFFRN